ncbi:hypothetical protein [Candidatus Lokiarchaeum ossiferum]|uniref:hypothetical protein n=1 Tax=Candidatus Lokiarchaeum ossiferum TaxID=2951803 RepID=UPI00352C8571
MPNSRDKSFAMGHKYSKTIMEAMKRKRLYIGRMPNFTTDYKPKQFLEAHNKVYRKIMYGMSYRKQRNTTIHDFFQDPLINDLFMLGDKEIHVHIYDVKTRKKVMEMDSHVNTVRQLHTALGMFRTSLFVYIFDPAYDIIDQIGKIPWRVRQMIPHAKARGYKISENFLKEAQILVKINDPSDPRDLKKIIIDALDVSSIGEISSSSISIKLFSHIKIMELFFPRSLDTEFSSILSTLSSMRPKIILNSDWKTSSELELSNFNALMKSIYTIGASMAKCIGKIEGIINKLSDAMSNMPYRDFYTIQYNLAGIHRFSPYHAELLCDLLFDWSRFKSKKIASRAREMFLSETKGRPTFRYKNSSGKFHSSFHHPEFFKNGSSEYKVSITFKKKLYNTALFNKWYILDIRQKALNLLRKMHKLAELFLTNIRSGLMGAATMTKIKPISGKNYLTSSGYAISAYMRSELNMKPDILFWTSNAPGAVRAGIRTIQTREWAVAISFYEFTCGIFPSINSAEKWVEEKYRNLGELFNKIQIRSNEKYTPYFPIQSLPDARQYIGSKISNFAVAINQLGKISYEVLSSGFEVSTLEAMTTCPDIRLKDGQIISRIWPGKNVHFPAKTEMSNGFVLPNEIIMKPRNLLISAQVSLNLGEWVNSIKWMNNLTPTGRQSYYILDFLKLRNPFYSGISSLKIQKFNGLVGVGVHGRGHSDPNYFPEKVPKVMAAHNAGLSIINIVPVIGQGTITNCNKDGSFKKTKKWYNVFGDVFIKHNLIDPEEKMKGGTKYVEIVSNSTNYFKRYHLPTVVLPKESFNIYEKLSNHHDMMGKSDKEILQEIGTWLNMKANNASGVKNSFKDIVSKKQAKYIMIGYQIKIYEDFNYLESNGMNKNLFQTPILDIDGKIQYYPCIEQWFANIEGKKIDGTLIKMNPLLESAFEKILKKNRLIQEYFKDNLSADVFSDLLDESRRSTNTSSWFNRPYNKNKFGDWPAIYNLFKFRPFR